jgi:hypothetical protein
MAPNGSATEPNVIYLSTGETAKRMGISRERVRELCRTGKLKGAVRKWDRGPWQIPVEAVGTWILSQSPDTLNDVGSPSVGKGPTSDSRSLAKRLQDNIGNTAKVAMSYQWVAMLSSVVPVA